jgi:hypothetical protein
MEPGSIACLWYRQRLDKHVLTNSYVKQETRLSPYASVLRVNVCLVKVMVAGDETAGHD